MNRTVLPMLMVLTLSGGQGTLTPIDAGTAVATTPVEEASRAGRSAYAGKRLADALIDLHQHGLQIVFSDQMVRPSFRIEEEPTAPEPRQILDQLLHAFALEVIEGPRGTLIVIESSSTEGSPTSALRGVVWSGDDLEAIAGATVLVTETGREFTTGLDGRFLIPDPGTKPVTLIIHRLGYLPLALDNVATGKAAPKPVVVFLDPAPVIEEEVLVTTSRVSVLSSEPTGGLALTRREIDALPHLGGDLFRALTLLPGASSNDVSAQFNIRGSRRDETQILLDGQELFDPYHLREFDSALSVVSSATLAQADLSTGGFGARHGDRMGGVLDLTSITPSGGPEYRLGLGIANAQVGGSGSFGDGKGDWLYDFRRGSIDLIGRLLADEDPEYWDTFGKLNYRLTPRQSLRLNVLVADDRLSFEEVDIEEGDSKTIDTSYDSSHVWLTHQTLLGSRLLLESSVSNVHTRRDRQGIELEEDAEITVSDARDLDVLAVRQAWSLQASPHHAIELGVEHRRFETDYDYLLETNFSDPVAQLGTGGEARSRPFEARLEERHTSAYLTDRMLLKDRLTLQIGLRYDRYSLTGEERLNPRFNLAWDVAEDSIFRVAWGRFDQSQRVYELLIEDDDTTIFPVERSEQYVIGFEKQLTFGSAALTNRSMTARIEAYRREVDTPRARYENLYEPINTFPEAEPDRIRIAPERSLAEGIELFLRGRTKRFGWWLNYTYSSTEDQLDGRSVARSFDQTHAVNLDLDFPVGKHWQLNFAWRFHTGWPTTPISLEETVDEDGETEFVPVLGTLYSERLGDYHRLDLRASREWQPSWGRIYFFVDVQNLYDRDNPAGFDIEIDDEEGTLERGLENWAGILPSAGIRLTF